MYNIKERRPNKTLIKRVRLISVQYKVAYITVQDPFFLSTVGGSRLVIHRGD